MFPTVQCGTVGNLLSRLPDYGSVAARCSRDTRRVIDGRGSTPVDSQQVTEQVRSLVDGSGLSREQFARRIGTSRTRLSTYVPDGVTPSAALLVRMRNLVGRIQHDESNR